MNTTAAAHTAGVTPETIRTWCRLGAIAARKVAGRWLINAASLARRAALTARTTNPPAAAAAPTTKKAPVTDIKITEEDGKLYVTAPFSRSANAAYKEIGGKFDGDRKAWVFPPRNIELVREKLRTHYGYDDQVTDTVDVRLDLGERTNRGEMWFGGRRIAERPGRDLRVRLGRDVVLIEGTFISRGGTMKYPKVDADKGTIVEIRGVPAGHPDLRDGRITIVTADADRAALEAEKAKLQARLAEIDTLLNQ